MNQKGFTAVELMFVVAITGILLAIAVPSFSSLIDRQRIASAASDLSSDLALTRMEATRRSGRATLCASADGLNCAASAAAWSTGWIVFGDANGNGVRDGTERVVKMRRLESGTLQISEAGGNVSATFQVSGRLNSQLVWTICRPGRTGRVLNARLTGAVTAYPTAAVCP